MLAGIQSEIKQLQAEEAAPAGAARRRRPGPASPRSSARPRRRGRQAPDIAAADFTSALAATSSDCHRSPPPPPSQYGGVVGIAMQYLGTPYVWGGSSPGGFDCSGLVAYAYAQVGVSLPHNAAAQYSYGTPVSYSDLQAGDLVFFSGLGHMGIYIGGGQFIHAPHTGDVVKISNMSDHGGYVGRTPPVDRPGLGPGRPYGSYRPSTASAKFFMIARRFSFSVGVTSSCSIVKSRGRITNRLICS